MQKTQFEKTGKLNEEQWLDCDMDSKGRENLNFFCCVLGEISIS